MQEHPRRTEPNMTDFLDRILDKGLCLEGPALLAVGTPGPHQAREKLMVASFDTNTGSYGALAPRTSVQSLAHDYSTSLI